MVGLVDCSTYALNENWDVSIEGVMVEGGGSSGRQQVRCSCFR